MSDPPGVQPDTGQPYLLQTNHMVVVEFALDQAEVRAVLPPDLEPADDTTGFMLFYTAGGVEGVPLSSACYFGIYLKGRDAPDGSPGIFVVNGYYSNEANLELSKSYSLRFELGSAAIAIVGDEVTASGGPIGNVAMSLRMRRRPNRPPLVLGTHQYYGERLGGLTTYSLAFAAMVFDGEVLSLRPTPSAPPLVHSLSPASVIRAMYVPGIPLCFSRPRAIASFEHITASDASHRAILDVLSGLGRAALVVDETGGVLFINHEGQAAVGPLLHSGRLAAASAPEHAKLVQLIRNAAHARSQSPADRIVLHRGSLHPVVVQAANYRGGWNGRPTALLLVHDPHERPEGHSLEGLELLGLTPGEARIAATVGEGQSSQEAARTLGLSQHTVRSTLKLIYSKLGIAKQTELAKIVNQVRWPT